MPHESNRRSSEQWTQVLEGAMVCIAAALVCLFLLSQCDPAYAAEEEEETRPRYYVKLVTWYKPEVPPLKQTFSFTWQSQCESFKTSTLDMLSVHLDNDPNFGFTMGDCLKETEE